MAGPADPGRWGTCTTCGDATPPGALRCPTCGKVQPAESGATVPGPKVRRRLRIHRSFRVIVVAGIAIALAGVMALAAYQGPPVAADPLTGHWLYRIDPGNTSVLSGAVTGGDYVTGNYSVLDPPGARLVLQVFNSTEYGRFARGLPATPAQVPANASSALIDFSAVVTDTYYFVWSNP